MLILNFNPFPNINTNRLSLRQIKKSDVKEMFFLHSDERVLKYLDKPPVQSSEEILQFIQKLNDMEQKNEAVTWAINHKEDTRLIGTICFWHIMKEHHRAEIGYTLHPDHQHKGIMQEAMKAVLHYGFNELKLHSVEANVNPNNQPSIRLLERNGFVREAYFKENWLFNNKFLDSAIYSLLAPKAKG